MAVPQTILLERNKLVARRIARVLACAGFTVRVYEEAEAVDAAALAEAALVIGDAFDADWLLGRVRERPALRALIYTAEPLDRLLGRALEEPRLVALLGRSGFEVPPREDDLLHVARRLREGVAAPFESHLAWGADGFAFALGDAAGRDHAVAQTIALAQRLGAPRRVGEMLGELAYELIMNALYDAPVDGYGRARFAHDRRAELTLPPDDRALYRCASDGVRVAVEVSDRFGGLRRQHLFGGLVRALGSRELDTSNGGAGLGLAMAYRNTTALFFDVEPGRRTRVTGLFELDLNLREFRLLPKTIHFPEEPHGS